jgi:RNA 2',3'-cyclic 3'-phosphodiesterase
MRFFIALHIPPENQAEIKKVQDDLIKIIPQARLTDPEKLHVTIAFIGEQPEQLQYGLAEIIKQAVIDIPPFELTPGYIDGFPTLHHPHTLWIGVKEDVDKLFILRERIKDSLSLVNEPVDQRRYVPHIAIAKVPDVEIFQAQERLFEKMMQQPFSPIKVTSVKLFQSLPNHEFHIHNTLAQIPLLKLKK